MGGPESISVVETAAPLSYNNNDLKKGGIAPFNGLMENPAILMSW